MGKNQSNSLGCVVVLLIASISLNVFLLGCDRKGYSQPENIPTTNDNRNSQLQELAKICGVKNVDNLSNTGLISEIKIKLNNKDQYYGKHLTKEDLSNLESYLADEPQILKTIKEYHLFMQMLDDKNFIIIP